jgi:hypothetical protein
MKKGRLGSKILNIVITVLIFWLADFLMHFTGVGETNFYYVSKFGNAILFSIIWFFVIDKKESWKKLFYSFIFGTYISFYYLIASYSGLVQFFFGVYARYSAPPFVIFGMFLTPILWWVFHSVMFYIGLEVSRLVRN